jgi:hypothetical protein
VQAGWPQSQAISASLEPASLHSWLQYLSPAGGTQTHGRCAHFFCLEGSVGIVWASVLGRSVSSHETAFNQVIAVHESQFAPGAMRPNVNQLKCLSGHGKYSKPCISMVGNPCDHLELRIPQRQKRNLCA